MIANYQVLEKLPTAKELPDSDETPVDNELQDLVPGLLKAILAIIWSEKMDWFFGVDMGIYVHPEKSPIVPDGFLSIGVPRIIDQNLRLSYVLWEEEKFPIMVLEIVSETRRGEYTTKKKEYVKLGILYYVIYNPLRKRKPRLEVHKLVGNEYELQTGEPYWFEELNLGIGREMGSYQGITREWLYWYDDQGQRYLTPEERIKQQREEGEKFGKQTGKQEIIFKQLRLKLGNIPLIVEQKIKQLDSEKLDQLSLELFNFSDLKDLQNWLK
jgi:Uma2 family endonuclease